MNHFGGYPAPPTDRPPLPALPEIPNVRHIEFRNGYSKRIAELVPADVAAAFIRCSDLRTTAIEKRDAFNTFEKIPGSGEPNVGVPDSLRRRDANNRVYGKPTTLYADWEKARAEAHAEAFEAIDECLLRLAQFRLRLTEVDDDGIPTASRYAQQVADSLAPQMGKLREQMLKQLRAADATAAKYSELYGVVTWFDKAEANGLSYETKQIDTAVTAAVAPEHEHIRAALTALTADENGASA